jgi:3',5'-nucleoside bisphosphate phosphatase
MSTGASQLSYESLHNHTVISDGTQTHLEVLATAAEHGVGIVAFTDHDRLPSLQTRQELSSYDGPVRWILGLELSCGLPKDMPGWDQSVLHLVGLFIDPDNSALVEYTDTVSRGRLDRMRHIVAHLVKLGFQITPEDCLDVAGESQVGQPHIVTALLASPTNAIRMEAIRLQMAEAARSDVAVRERYDRMMTDGPRQYPYTLFMSSRSFRPVPKQSFGGVVDLDQAVAMIRGAGGVAVLAHWFFDAEKLPEESLRQLVVEGRIDGLETSSVDGLASQYSSQFIPVVRQLGEDSHVVTIVASDSHGVDDFQKFAASPLALESTGQTARLVDQLSIDTRWSSLG